MLPSFGGHSKEEPSSRKLTSVEECGATFGSGALVVWGELAVWGKLLKLTELRQRLRPRESMSAVPRDLW